jgi:leucyl aminopeptidase
MREKSWPKTGLSVNLGSLFEEDIMQYTLTTQPLDTLESDCVIVGAFQGGSLSASAKQIDAQMKGALKKIQNQGDFGGNVGESLLLPLPTGLTCKRVLLVGYGKPEGNRLLDFRKLIRTTLSAVKSSGAKKITWALDEFPVTEQALAWKIQRAINLAAEVVYQFNEFKSTPAPKLSLKTLEFWLPKTALSPAVKAALHQGTAIAKGMDFTRNLANRPANFCTPTHLAKEAMKISKEYAKMECKILDEKDMEKLGMGSLLSVSHGSREPAKLIILEYKGRDKKTAPHILVGKGITFDTGGISLKPGAAMDEMKFDMCGAASVLGTLLAAAELKLPLNIIGVVASAENMPGGSATKPGDIVTSMSGQTIEILNTDAEGRLVLCDALTYIERYKPASVIDIATLTGAMRITLGNYACGLFGNNPKLQTQLQTASVHSDEAVWPFPVPDELQETLDSNFADIANIGNGTAGSITAACFLSRFTQKYPWAHLDIASIAYNTGKAKGATARPVPLLVQYLVERC